MSYRNTSSLNINYKNKGKYSTQKENIQITTIKFHRLYYEIETIKICQTITIKNQSIWIYSL